MSERARRYNSGKDRYELVPHRPLKNLVQVYTRGAHKYSIYEDAEGKKIKGSEIPIEEAFKYSLIDDGAENWRKGMSWRDTIGAVKRHIAAWENNESIDPDLKTRHLANAAWGLFTLMEYEFSHPELDDRPKSYLVTKKIGLDIDGVLADFTGHLMKVNATPDHTPKHWNDPVVRKAFELIKKDPNFWLTIPPLLTREDIPFEPHCYITARSVDSEVTKEWLYKNGFPTAPVYCVGAGESKVETAKKAGIDIFIDDSYENFLELNAAGIFTYLYTAPYNVKYEVGGQRIDRLTDLL